MVYLELDRSCGGPNPSSAITLACSDEGLPFYSDVVFSQECCSRENEVNDERRSVLCFSEWQSLVDPA